MHRDETISAFQDTLKLGVVEIETDVTAATARLATSLAS